MPRKPVLRPIGKGAPHIFGVRDSELAGALYDAALGVTGRHISGGLLRHGVPRGEAQAEAGRLVSIVREIPSRGRLVGGRMGSKILIPLS